MIDIARGAVRLQDLLFVDVLASFVDDVRSNGNNCDDYE